MSGNDFGWDNEPTEREWLEGLDPRTEQERRDESGNDAARLREDERRELLNGRRLAGENERGRIVRIAERILKDRLDAAEAAQRDREVVGRVRAYRDTLDRSDREYRRLHARSPKIALSTVIDRLDAALASVQQGDEGGVG